MSSSSSSSSSSNNCASSNDGRGLHRVGTSAKLILVVASLSLLGIVYQNLNISKCGGAAGHAIAKENVLVACSEANLTPCTHRQLSYNLFSKTNQGHLFLDDLLNLILYQPEIICNCRTPLLLEGLLDYVPERIQVKPCHEDFGYYGYYQTSTLHYQVQNRVRIARYTELDLTQLFAHVARKIHTNCSAAAAAANNNNNVSRILYIQRLAKYGRALPDQLVTPPSATRLVVNVEATSTLALLCSIVPYDLVVCPWGSELILPIILQKPFVALRNNWTDSFYYEIMWQQRLVYAELFFDSIPHEKKPHHPYYNNFQPSKNQLAVLQELVTNNNNHSLVVQYPPMPRTTKPFEDGFLYELRLARKAYLDEVAAAKKAPGRF